MSAQAALMTEDLSSEPEPGSAWWVTGTGLTTSWTGRKLRREDNGGTLGSG